METEATLARSELILGGQKSGKSRRAEALARSWLEAASAHRAVLIATAQPWDAEMQQRIARHQCERLERVPALATVEEPRALAEAVWQHSRSDTLVLVDCLTLWLTNLRMPAGGTPQSDAHIESSFITPLLEAISHACGPLVLVGNEIGLGVIPMGVDVRAFVDALGNLNQQMAQRCARVTLMVAGLPLSVKDTPC